MNSDGSGMRIKSWESLVPALSVQGVHSFSAGTAKSSSGTARASGKSKIDLRLYHQISIDPEMPVEEAIALLYKSGAVEIAEPVYAAKSYLRPNDPRVSDQYYLPLVNALDAWDLVTGRNDIIIAILDSGVDLQHPDLAANIYTNEADPIDGVDNDEDGYVDNYYGWDFAGDDYISLQGDNDPSTNLSNLTHGTMVAGAASAVTNNNEGIAGVGFNARLMILKHSADNDTRDEGNALLSNLLQGVLYAAEHGADIINASYGSTYYSQISHDIYRYVALEYDVLVVAAAGNESSVEPHYPSDYDYVLSVSATTAADGRASFSNYGYRVDIAAPGSDILTTAVGGGYTFTNGTSFAAPIVSGAAALVKTVYPDFNGAQIGEVLRTTADPAFNSRLGSTYKDKMGRGRLDVERALTVQSPSIRMDNPYIQGPNGDVAKAGQEAIIYGTFTNFLWPAAGASVTLTPLSSHITMLQESVELGDMAMMDSVSNQTLPFRIRVNTSAPSNAQIVFRLDYTAANGYTDYQYIRVLVNPSYFNINENLVTTTLAGNGRIGYQDTEQAQGLGFVYNDVNMLFEMGVMMGTSETRVLSTVRGSTPGDVDDDFKVVNKIARDNPGMVSDSDVYGTFDDSKSSPLSRLNVEVDYRSFVWRERPFEKMVVVEYDVTNTGNDALENYYLGLFADWDINQDNYRDMAGWDAATQTGYIYTPDPTERWVGAIQVLSGTPNYWAIDNDENIENNPFGVYDGYTDQEKFRSMSNAIGREEAGIIEEGNDVSHTVSSGPYNIPAGGTVRIAFALHGGSSIEDILSSAEAARLLYETIKDGERPVPVAPVTGIIQNDLPALAVYPNPARDILNIALPQIGKEPILVRLMDVTGRHIASKSYTAGKTTVQFSMPGQDGVYFLEVVQGNKRTIRRVVVQQ
ncbi:S8 family serine peptidase [Cesiribacter sp. SM1]|uniref:S8 family serine peptidase n=1 Tax=Cesiribacter sp. SM1 TaxID=2861196 RepID=UPI001CD1CE68|nr:S8 family serine peptidase [Cesiribacter sp. SM1]